MAKLEIPSIVVHSGSPSVPGMSMDRTSRQTPQLRKQKSSMDEGDTSASGCIHHSKFEASTTTPNNNNNTSNSNNNQEETKPPEVVAAAAAACSTKQPSPTGNSPKNDDSEKSAPGPQPQLSRSRSNGKMKMLTRSHAMREATSPPPDPAATSAAVTPSVATSPNSQSPSGAPSSNSNAKNNSQASKSNNSPGNNGGGGNQNSSNSNSNSSNNNSNNYNSKSNKNGNNRNNKEQNNASSNRPNHRQSKNVIYISSPQESWSGLLFRDNSTDSQVQDVSKSDLDAFIAQQMSTKNRPLLIKVEEELSRLAQDPRPIFFRFPQMSSFHRMLVHRAATYFNMDHNLDQTGCVVVNRTKNTRLPEKNFVQIMKDIKGLHNRAYSSEEPRKSILKRDFASFEDSQYKSDDKQLSLESRRSKSFEEREEEYERARRRIFSRDDSADSGHRNSDSNQDSMEDLHWSDCATWASGESEATGRYLKPSDRSPRLLKTESYESRDSLKANSLRNSVSKSYSFGGYTGNATSGNSNTRTGPSHGQSFSGLNRGDSNASSVSTGSRMLAKQDSGSSVSSRLSPSSSGYKSQSQQSDATLSATPSPTATPLSLLPMSSQSSQDTLSPEPPVIWPMTALGNIPSGSVLINPATGQPICNADGSVYRYDPENPLTLHVPRADSPSKQTSPSPPGGLNEKGDEKTEEERKNWTSKVSNETSQSITSVKASQSSLSNSPTVAPKASTQLDNSKNTSPQPQLTLQDTSKCDKSYQSQIGKASDLTENSQEISKPKPKDVPQDKRAQVRHQSPSGSRKNDSDRQSTSSKTVSDATTSNLTVPASEINLRSVTNASTSPMLLQSPQRQLPAQAGQPIVVPAQNVPVGYPMNGVPQQQPMQMVPVMNQVPSNAAVYPVQPNSVPHYHMPGYTSPEGQTYLNGYPTVPYMPHVNSYPVNVDPTTGSYVGHQQQASCQNSTCPPGAPCYNPGYPCPYSGQVVAGASAPVAASVPHAGYEQRNMETSNQAVNEMSNYMMGMNLGGSVGGSAVVDQRGGGGDITPSRAEGQSPQQGPGAPQTPHVMLTGTGSYYWGPSHNQGYPPTVMYYYPQNSVASPQNSAGSGPGSMPTPSVSATNSSTSFNRGSSPNVNFRENNSNKSSPSSASSSSTTTNVNSNRNNFNRSVAASYAKGAAIYQPPVYSVSMTGPNIPQQTQDRTGINGYPNDCVGAAAPQQQVVYTVSSMHSSTVPTQSYQPSIYSSAGTAVTPSSNAPPGALAYYQGAGDSSTQSQGQQLLHMNPYAGHQGYIPASGTPPLTPNNVLGHQGSYGVHPYLYGMYSQAPNVAGGSTSPATYPNVAPHQSPMMRGMIRPNLMVGGIQSSPPPRSLGPKGFPRGQSPVGRKDQNGSGENIRFSQPYSVPMYNIAASRYMSGDMRYMAGRLPFSIPTNTYHRAIRPFQTSYYPRPHSQPSGEAQSLARTPRVRKPTSTQARSPARGGPFVGKENKAFSKPPAVMKTS